MRYINLLLTLTRNHVLSQDRNSKQKQQQLLHTGRHIVNHFLHALSAAYISIKRLKRVCTCTCVVRCCAALWRRIRSAVIAALIVWWYFYCNKKSVCLSHKPRVRNSDQTYHLGPTFPCMLPMTVVARSSCLLYTSDAADE